MVKGGDRPLAENNTDLFWLTAWEQVHFVQQHHLPRTNTKREGLYPEKKRLEKEWLNEMHSFFSVGEIFVSQAVKALEMFLLRTVTHLVPCTLLQLL